MVARDNKLFIFLCYCYSVTLFSRLHAENPVIFSLSPEKLPKIVKKSEARAKKIETKAQEQIALLKELTEKNILEIRQQTEDQIAQSGIITEQEAERLRQKALIEEEFLKKYLQKEARVIQYVAAKQVLFLMNTAEEILVKMRAKARQEALEEDIKETALHLELFTPTVSFAQAQKPKITHAWKNQVKHNFDRNIALLKKIILDTETPDQAEDLVEVLSEQSIWFDNTLRSAHYVHDAHQEKIIKKQALLNKIILVHKKAILYLEILAKILNLSPSEKKKVGLAILYDLGAVIKPDLVFSPIPDEEIKHIVARTVREFAQISHQELQVPSRAELVDNINAQTNINALQQELSSTQNRLETMRQEQKKSYEEAHKAGQDLQKTLDKTRQEIETIGQKISPKVYTELRQRFIPLLEEKEKNNLELELIIQDTKDRATHTQETLDN